MSLFILYVYRPVRALIFLFFPCARRVIDGADRRCFVAPKFARNRPYNRPGIWNLAQKLLGGVVLHMRRAFLQVLGINSHFRALVAKFATSSRNIGNCNIKQGFWAQFRANLIATSVFVADFENTCRYFALGVGHHVEFFCLALYP